MPMRSNRVSGWRFFALVLLLSGLSVSWAPVLRAASADTGSCLSGVEDLDMLEEYMLTVLFERPFADTIVRVELKPTLGKMTKGRVPLRNWRTTVEDDGVIFEKTTDGANPADLGFVAGLEYGTRVDYVDVAMVLVLEDDTKLVWGGDASSNLPYQRAFWRELPEIPGVDDVTEIVLDVEPCYNEDFIPRQAGPSKAMVAALGTASLALIATLTYLIWVRVRLR